MTDQLPAHSPLGASSAERWMNCPGSVALITRVRSDDAFIEKADPDYTRDGKEAHALGAHCLTANLDCWEAEDSDEYPHLTADMMSAVQEYLGYVRSLPGDRKVEHRVHLPDFHPQFYGTLDCVVVTPDCMHVVDYKHGVGVVVDADDNQQLMYYAFGFIMENPDIVYDRLMPVRVTIVQPRAFHPDGNIRTWQTTVGHICDWAEGELRPAMALTQDLEYLDMGSWCRFCPAKLVCPAFDGLAKKALHTTEITYTEAQFLRMLIKAIEEKALERLSAGKPVEGAKLVKQRANRAWKDAAEKALATKYGQKAFVTKVKSPAVVEDEMTGGKEFVAEYAFTPDAGYTVALTTDKRKEVAPPTGEGQYGLVEDYAQYRKTS